MRILRTAVLLPLLLAIPAVPAEAQSGKARKKDRDQTENTRDREGERDQGVGKIPLGATAYGVIVQGFYNTISFEAVRGTKVSFHLRTKHKLARPLAELLDTHRASIATFKPVENEPKHLSLTEFEVPETGEFTVRFGFLNEENGNYELTSAGAYPTGFTQTVKLAGGGEASVPIDGMLGRKIARLEFLLPDGVDVDFSLRDSYDFETDLSKHTRRTTFGRRVILKGVPIDSATPLNLRLTNVGDAAATFDVEVEYDNPRISRRRIKI